MGRGGGLGQECEQVKMENEGNKNGGTVAAPPPSGNVRVSTSKAPACAGMQGWLGGAGSQLPS